MATRKRRFKKGRIDFLSLCHAGANNLAVVYKADGKDTPAEVVLKASDDRGEITALVYVPEHRDNQGEIASAPVIKDMAYGFAAGGHQIDVLHNEEPVGVERAYVAENFIVQKGDPRFQGWKDRSGKTIDPTGAWGVVIKVNDPSLRALYRDGKWAGVSMGGDGDFIDETRVGKTGQNEDSMTPEEIAALVNKTLDERDARVKKAAEAEKAGKILKLPVFKGDLSKATAKQLREHAASVKKAQRFVDVDMNDPEAVAKVAEELEAEEKAAKVAKTSTQPDSAPTKTLDDSDEDSDEDEGATVTKDEVEIEVLQGETLEQARTREVAKFMVSSLPEHRRKATAGK